MFTEAVYARKNSSIEIPAYLTGDFRKKHVPIRGDSYNSVSASNLSFFAQLSLRNVVRSPISIKVPTPAKSSALYQITAKFLFDNIMAIQYKWRVQIIFLLGGITNEAGSV